VIIFSTGLSLGLHQSGVVATKWAIEINEDAAKAYKENNPNTEVFAMDSNTLLQEIMEGAEQMSGHKLPKKGDVEFLCGGPPCQGFSALNRFNDTDTSKNKVHIKDNIFVYTWVFQFNQKGKYAF
jgi:DNA (cytosine-5)-methyltransferase 1